MKKPKIDVMLSSTSRDLPSHREQATEAILRSGMHPIIMETLTASLGDAISESLRLVDDAEIYVGIFGMRYGYIPDDARNPDGISITEMEYRHAMKRDIPVLIFIMRDDHPGPATAAEGETFYEQDETGKAKLTALKKELTTQHVVGFFESPQDLRAQLIQALHSETVKERAYTIAGIDEDSPPVPEKTPLPAPPAFYADPPYTLTSEFIGRADELKRLNRWAQSDDPMMIVEAIGGMGKSAVTWEWVKNHADKLGFDGIMWWSFYESGSNMSAFVRHALAYITRQDPDALKGRGMKKNFHDLLLALQKGRYLLVLDGLERALVAYHRWNAAQMRDDTVEEAESIIKDRDIRACTDPKDDEVLRGLLSCGKTRVLISSRLLPLALEDRTGNLSKGVAHVHLNGLHPDDALTLTHKSGVKVEDVPRFQRFMAQFGHHSLLVKLVAGRVLKFRRARGDFDGWYLAEGRVLHVRDFDLRQSQTHILQYALDGLDTTQRRFLSQVAAFGDAISYDTLAVFNPFLPPLPDKDKIYAQFSGALAADEYLRKRRSLEMLRLEKRREEQRDQQDGKRWQEINIEIEQLESILNAHKEIDRQRKDTYDKAVAAYPKSPAYTQALAQFDELLIELEERGLLRWEREKDTYDMHPVVRGTAFDELEGETRTTTFDRIRGHFEAQPQEDIEAANTVADLTNTIAIYRALVGAGKWEEAARFFTSKLLTKLQYNIAAYYTVIELLTPLFPDGTDTLPHLRDPENQGSIVMALAAVFYLIGRHDDALMLDGLALNIWLSTNNLGNLGVCLRNYAISLRAESHLALAVRAFETALALAQATDTRQMIYSTTFLLGIYRDTGEWEKVEAAYRFLEEYPSHDVSWESDKEKYYAETRIHRGLEADAILDSAEKLSHQAHRAFNHRRLKALRAEVALAEGDYTAAARYFEQALTLARTHGSAEIATYMGRLARTYAKQGERDKALHYITEALSQPLKEEIHDLYSSVAEACLVLGDTDKAKDYVLKAYEAAWADGPPYVWWWALERAKKVLGALGVPYPEMPPYDPAKIGKFPYQDEIEAIIEREKAKRKK
ncbi:MAG: DUF4062 domain-containing protein [Anaerolineaceae bacterium]|nr:DUF4062 domain-containing protein [Anaerolineaceae bacterium]